MITITYETFYTSDRTFIVILRNEKYPGQSRRVRLMCPGSQYLPTIREILAGRGFTMRVVDEI